MRVPDLLLVAPVAIREGRLLLRAHERAHDAHRAGRVQHVYDRALIGGRDLHRRVRFARRGPPDQKRHREAFPGHLPRHVHHLI